MKTVVQHACDPSATITSIINYANATHESILNPPDANIYFSALLSNQIPLTTQAGIVGLLIAPSKDIESEGGRKRNEDRVISPDLCHTYLLAVSTHVDCVLELWNLGRLDSRHFDNFMKAIRTAASICAEYKRSLISSSGILPALAKLATDFRRTNRSIISTHDVANTVPSLTQNVLTQAHVEFLQCCILASQYSIAKQFVDGNPIYSVPSVKGALSSESFLRYFYFLGMVHLACDDYTNAISAFQQCMTLPSKMVSAITIEARKKLLIAKCLMLFHLDDDEYENCAQPDIRQSRVKTAEGGPTSGDKSKSTKGGKICDIIFDLPYTASIPAVKSCSTTRSFKLYEKLVGDYLSIDVAEFTKTINEGAQTLTRDGNMGLVKQLIPLIQYRSLRNISKIYEAIPMAKLATKLGFGGDPRGLMDTESYLLKVTLEQKNNSFGSPVDFTIDSESSIVYFYEVGYDENDDPGCHATQVDLQKRVTTAMDLAERISKMDIAVTCSTKYQCCLASKNPEDSGEAKSSVISDM